MVSTQLELNFSNTVQKMRPVIKWTGGKYKEYDSFSAYIPSYDRYFEPFFGGGGVFFAMQPKGKCFLNDKSKDLVRFYSLIKSSVFKTALLKYASAWDTAGEVALVVIAETAPSFFAYLQNEIELSAATDTIKKTVERVSSDARYAALFSNSFLIDCKAFTKKLIASLVDKFRRIKNISIKEKRPFLLTELADHIETGIKSGLYLFLRDLMNHEAEGKIVMDEYKTAANWYFVREFCYASMFRYNRDGGFNIPYGGIAYNRKNFRVKVENIFSFEVRMLFYNVSFSNLDFADFLSQNPPTKDDFVFLDPPYDSEFSEYDQNSFTREDQVRLRDTLFELTAKWMLVIKETDFIRQLYSSPVCSFIEVDKTYTYNVRGRNNRDTRHLIITNYTT